MPTSIRAWTSLPFTSRPRACCRSGRCPLCRRSRTPLSSTGSIRQAPRDAAGRAGRQPGGSGRQRPDPQRVSTIRGLIINRFSGDGIRIEPGFTENHVYGNFIGTDGTGTMAMGNGAFGIEIEDWYFNVIGASDPESRNVISGNAGGGIFIHGDSFANAVTGNLIGTQLDGVSAWATRAPGCCSTRTPFSTVLAGVFLTVLARIHGQHDRLQRRRRRPYSQRTTE